MIISFFALIARRKKSGSLLLGVLIILSNILFFSPLVRAGSQVSHNAIAINSDSDFTVANGVTGGSGTASDPYVISGWSIQYQPSTAQIGISNTRAYFVVRNVTAYGRGNGIILSNVANGRLENLESDGGSAFASGIGILVTGSNNIWITNVQVSSGGTPHEGGGGPGIIIRSSSNIFIANNNLLGSLDNVLTVDATNVTITGNNIWSSQTGYGMSVGGTNVTVSQNAFHYSGLVLGPSVKVTSDNTVNGKPLYYYHDCNNLSLSNVPVGQLIIKNCSNVQLSNLSISNTDIGIAMYGVHHALIQNVNSTSNNQNNVIVDRSLNITIEHSDFSYVPFNVFFGSGALSAVRVAGSNNTIIDGSTFAYSQRALDLGSDLNATVSGNTFTEDNGMLCLSSSTGIHIYHNNFLISPDYTRICLSDTQPGHFWDNGFPSGGNYWSNYTGTDPDNDGMGDTPYPIAGGVYQDRYPLMNPYPASVPLTIEFNWAPYVQMVGQPVTLKASAVGGVAPYSFSWNFGDGSTGSGNLVTHTFASRPPPGSYTVRLTVTDSASPTHAVQTLAHYVFVSAPPPQLTATFTSTSLTGSSSSAAVEQWVRFDASASGGTSPYSYSWSFGDGTTGSGLSTFHTYCSPGTFTIALTVKDSGSPQQTTTVQKSFTVTSPPNSCVRANFTYSPSSPRTGQTVTFNGTMSGGTPPYNSFWEFGDGSGPVPGSSATHAFSAAGNYNVIFHVTDSSYGDVASGQIITVTVVVNSTPSISVVRGMDNGIYWSSFSTRWSNWQPLSGGTAARPVLCSSASGSVELIVRGLDNSSIWHATYSNGTWSAWDSPGGATNDQPACVFQAGLLRVVVRGMDDGLWYNLRNNTSGRWGTWQSLGGFVTGPPVLASSPSSSRLDLMVQGGDDSIWHKSFLNGKWSDLWDSPSGSTASPPAIVSDGQTLHVVVRGMDNGVWYNSLNFTTDLWSVWSSLGGATPTVPSLALDASGTIHIVVRGMDNGIYHKSKPARGYWTPSWDSPGGNTAGAIVLVAQGDVLKILVKGMNNGIYSSWLIGSYWQGWTDLGGATPSPPSFSNLR